ncbi:MAG TPA: heme o synthase [Planctomycetota bacterium]|nr:heme o synthase [Planctomycetota bacterium]
MSAPTVERAGVEAAGARATVGDWVTLCKPRLNAMAVATTLGGAWIGSRGDAPAALLVHAVGGTALAACGASALNMVMERRSDALMRRTRERPVPAGRLGATEAAVFGALLGAGGIAWLAAATTLLAAALAALTLLSYLAVYTPLKGRSATNTLVGAVPGALPPLIGWAAVGRELDAGAWVLFTALYLWQIPHFLSIAWLHREDYARAGLVMLPGVDGDGEAAGRHAVRYALMLVLLPFLAPATGLAGGALFAVGAALLGAGYAAAAWGFLRVRSDARARTLLRASLLYVPALFALLVLDPVR